LHVWTILEAKGKVFYKEKTKALCLVEKDRSDKKKSMGRPIFVVVIHVHADRWFVSFLLLYHTHFSNLHLHHFCNPTVICFFFFWHKEPTIQTSKCLVFVRFTTKVETLGLFKENVISFDDRTHCKQGMQ